MRKIPVDAMEIRRRRRAAFGQVKEFLSAVKFQLRTLKEIESSGYATLRSVKAICNALQCTECDIKPVLLSGSQVAERLQQNQCTYAQLADHAQEVHLALGELATISAHRVQELAEKAVAPAMHHEWRILAAVLNCPMNSLQAAGASTLVAPSTPRVDDAVCQSLIKQLRDRFVANQDDVTGHFAPSAWSSAQIMLGLLSSSVKDTDEPAAIARGLNVLWNRRWPSPPGLTAFNQDQGWALFHNIPGSPCLADVTCWVVAASVQALSHPLLWASQERQHYALLVRSELNLLLTRQFLQEGHPQDGGFCPTAAVLPANTRTYSTVMAVWVLLLARRASAFSKQAILIGDIDARIIRAQAWLLRHHRQQGWVPKPSREYCDGECFLGLTSQVHFVLSELYRDDTIPALLNHRMRLRHLEDTFFERFAGEFSGMKALGPAWNHTVPHDDTFLDGTTAVLEPMSFFWWPWTLAFVRSLEQRPDYARSPRLQLASDTREQLLGKIASIDKRALRPDEGDPFLAESLFALSLGRF